MNRTTSTAVLLTVLLSSAPRTLRAQALAARTAPVSSIGMRSFAGAGLKSPTAAAFSFGGLLTPALLASASLVPSAPSLFTAAQSAPAASNKGSALSLIQSRDAAVGVDAKGRALRTLFDLAAPIDGDASREPVVPAQTAPADPQKAWEHGLLHGLMPLAAALSRRTSGSGYVDYWIHHFEVRRDMGNAAAASLDRRAQQVKNQRLKLDLEELSRDLRAAPQRGYGDDDYWVGLVGDQNRVFQRVAERIARVRDAGVPSRDIPQSGVTGLWIGLLPAAQVLATQTNGYGDADYWLHHFEVRRDMGNSISESLRDLSRRAQDQGLKLDLEELARDLDAAPQRGSGDSDYWSRKASDQDTVFKRVFERIVRLGQAL
jgi:hypothetical protein